MNEIPSYDIEKINLYDYNEETRKIILSNLKNYTKLIDFNCYSCNLTELPDLPNSLTELECHHNNLTELPDLPNSLTYLECTFNNLDLTYPNIKINIINESIYETINEINEINSKNRIIKRMKLLNRNLLLEHSAMITMNPKRIERLLDNLEIDFYDGSFDTLTS